MTHLKHSIIALQEGDKARNNAALNDAFNRRILLLGKKFTEFRGRVQLTIGIIGEDTRNHVVGELKVMDEDHRQLDEGSRTVGVTYGGLPGSRSCFIVGISNGGREEVTSL